MIKTLMELWIEELEELKAKDEEQRLSDAEYARWNDLAHMIGEGFKDEARLYDRRGDDE